MLIAFQIIVLILIIGNGIGVVNEDNKSLQLNMALTTIACLVAFLATVMWL